MHVLKQRVAEKTEDGLLLLGVGGVHAKEGRGLALQAAALPIDGPCMIHSSTSWGGPNSCHQSFKPGVTGQHPF